MDLTFRFHFVEYLKLITLRAFEHLYSSRIYRVTKLTALVGVYMCMCSAFPINIYNANYRLVADVCKSKYDTWKRRQNAVKRRSDAGLFSLCQKKRVFNFRLNKFKHSYVTQADGRYSILWSIKSETPPSRRCLHFCQSTQTVTVAYRRCYSMTP